MITQKRRKYFRLLSIVISFLMIVTSIPSFLINATTENENIIPSETEEILSEVDVQSIYKSTQIQKSAEAVQRDLNTMKREQLIQNGMDPDKLSLSALQSKIEVENLRALTAYERILDDGVYAISNIGNSNSQGTMYMDTNRGHWLPGYNMQQYKFTEAQTPCDTFTTSALFKIRRIEETGSYTIRIMTNNALSFDICPKSDNSGLEVLTKYIPLDDDLVEYEDTYVIQQSGSGFKIRKYASTNCIAANAGQASGDAGKPDSFLYATNNISDQIRWNFTQYTGAERNSVTMSGSESLEVGKTTILTPVFYSTRPGFNVISLNMNYVQQGTYAMTGADLYGNFTVTPYLGGSWSIGIFAKNGSSENATGMLLDLAHWDIALPIEEGIYFLKNVKFENRYVQINNTSNMYKENEIIELHNFHGYYEQRWRFTHLWNGYYKIESTYSDKVLTCPTGPNNDVVRQTTFTNELTQSWKVVKQSDGTYKMYAGSNSNCYMTAGTPTATADPDLIVRSPQSDGADKWKICDFNTSVLLAIDDADGASRYPYFNDTKTILQTEKNGIVSVVSTERYSYKTKNEMISYLNDNNIFVVHTHGYQEGFKISNSDPQYITMDDIAQTDLSNISFALLLTCYTGENFSPSHIVYNNPTNIIEQMVICGAETVVGFSDKTYVTDCNNFAPLLMHYLIYEEYTIQDAIEAIDYSNYITDMSDIAEIAGNSSKKLR